MNNLTLFFAIKLLLAKQPTPMSLRALYDTRTVPIVGSYDQCEHELTVYFNGTCVWRKHKVLTGEGKPVAEIQDKLMGEVLTEAAARGLFLVHQDGEARRASGEHRDSPIGVHITSNYLFDGATPENEILSA